MYVVVFADALRIMLGSEEANGDGAEFAIDPEIEHLLLLLQRVLTNRPGSEKREVRHGLEKD